MYDVDSATAWYGAYFFEGSPHAYLRERGRGEVRRWAS